MRPDRQHPRRGRHRPAVVSHEPPVTDPSLSVSRETPPVEEQARQALLAVADETPPPPLSRERILKLEAATAAWIREVRVGGPGPEDTLLYASPKPPPPARAAAVPLEQAPLEQVPLEQAPLEQAPTRVLDWTSRHDERSRAFDVSDRLAGRAPIVDKLWPHGPIFDQGTTPPLSARDASGCVGMAVAAAGNSLDLAQPSLGNGPPKWLTKDDALALYDRAQDLDHVSGKAYAGTSVLAGMKAGQEAGLWTDYLWAFGTRPLAQALLQVGPAVVGIPWDTSLEHPDAEGVIRPGGKPAGGHALALVGIISSKPGGPWFVAQQSRGPKVGNAGLVLIHHKDLARLLAGVGEAAIPVPPGGVK